MKERAGSRPPISSMTTSTSAPASTRAASVVMGSRVRSRPSRRRVRSRSATRLSTRRQPARSSSIARSDSRSLTTPAPTVPRPSRPRRTSFTTVMSVAEAFQATQRLPDALFVLHQGEPHVALAVLPEADAGRDRDLRFLDEELGELQRAHRAERLGNRRPHEHRPLGLLHRPADLVEAVDEHVAALAVHLHDVAHDALIALEGDDAGDLNRLEGAV